MAEAKYNIKVLDNFAAILDLFTYNDNSFTLDEISAKSGLPKTTVFRILKNLEQHGIFKHNPIGQTYSLGMRVLELGGIVYNSLSLRKVAAPYLDSLSHDLKATILLGIMQGDQVQYIDKRESESIIRTVAYAGLKRPPHYGILGLTLVAYMNNDERVRLLNLYPPTKLTENTMIGIKELLRRMDELKEVGYCVERGEVIEGVLGVGVPIADFSGKVVAALGACLPEFQIKSDGLERAIQKLLEASRAISKELGNV
ncbi:MAG: Transcriptional regulator KdgR [Syntrophorhabdaceae bacterium PtaU1.Bin034]|jgi:DNA-binding IclR family transcriptional regulator|nr:MAG: Transcriptional regulator KdgR [Syntrophorhabdaceae bacterium PtaU1.Bin034]